MVDGVLTWAGRQKKEWAKSIAGMESGIFGTFEIRNGEKVDTTADSIADLSRRISELDALIKRHEARNA